MSTHVEVLLCPECSTPVQEVVTHSGFQSGGTTIGPAHIPCPGCGIEVISGLSEWSDKHIVRKLTFFFGRFLWFVVASIFVAGLFGVAVSAVAINQRWLHPKHEEVCFVAAFGIGTLFMGLAFLRRISKEIRESNDRLASTRPGSPFELNSFPPQTPDHQGDISRPF